MTHAGRLLRVLAIDPATRGLGFAVLESTRHLVDWGVKHVRGDKNAAARRQVRDLMKFYQPDLLVLEDVAARTCRRHPRVRALISNLREDAETSGLRVRSLSWYQVREALTGSTTATKEQVAIALAKRFEELVPRLPPRRKPWMSEDTRMAIFDAVALGLTFLHRQRS